MLPGRRPNISRFAEIVNRPGAYLPCIHRNTGHLVYRCISMLRNDGTRVPCGL